MRIGKKVAICQDGKWGRCSLGVVTKTHKGNRVLVKFTNGMLNDGVETECWARMYKRNKGKRMYGGYAGNGCFDWFKIVSIKKVLNAGIRVKGLTHD